MTDPFRTEIAAALGPGLDEAADVRDTAPAHMPACFDVTGLAVESLRAATAELVALTGAGTATLNHRHALMWFGMTLRPEGWAARAAWDPIAGDYPTADGWIRLHTNAPHHRQAALDVLGAPPDRAEVAAAVAGWRREDLESAVVAAGGAAAAMHDAGRWHRHPQGKALARTPLIGWQTKGAATRTTRGLAGCRVFDLTRVLAGPVATRFLAGYGAEVLRIDPPGWSEPGVEEEVTLGKRRATLDLRQKADRARFEALLADADVLVHGYRPAALDGLGYDAARRAALAPDAVEVTLNAYGWAGPWAGRRGFDSLVQMSTGIAAAGMHLTQADRPVPLPVQALDHATGYLMAAAVLRALRLRRDRGVVMGARLALARTAALLTSGGAARPVGQALEETEADLAPSREATGWGPARRVNWPVRLDGAPPDWPYPSGPLGTDPPAWPPG